MTIYYDNPVEKIKTQKFALFWYKKLQIPTLTLKLRSHQQFFSTTMEISAAMTLEQIEYEIEFCSL